MHYVLINCLRSLPRNSVDRSNVLKGCKRNQNQNFVGWGNCSHFDFQIYSRMSLELLKVTQILIITPEMTWKVSKGHKTLTKQHHSSAGLLINRSRVGLPAPRVILALSHFGLIWWVVSALYLQYNSRGFSISHPSQWAIKLSEGMKISYPTVIPPISVETLQWKYRYGFWGALSVTAVGWITPMYFVLLELSGKD